MPLSQKEFMSIYAECLKLHEQDWDIAIVGDTMRDMAESELQFDDVFDLTRSARKLSSISADFVGDLSNIARKHRMHLQH